MDTPRPSSRTNRTRRVPQEWEDEVNFFSDGDDGAGAAPGGTGGKSAAGRGEGKGKGGKDAEPKVPPPLPPSY